MVPVPVLALRAVPCYPDEEEGAAAYSCHKNDEAAYVCDDTDEAAAYIYYNTGAEEEGEAVPDENLYYHGLS